MAATSENLPDILIPFAFFALAISLNLAFRRHRRNSLQALADRFHLSDRGSSLPGDFPVQTIAGNSSPWVRDVFSGQVGEDTFLVMDTSVGWGRQSYTRTNVARRCTILPPTPRLPKRIVYQQVGHWRVVFYHRSLFGGSAKMSPELVEHLWKLLGGPGSPAPHSALAAHPSASAEILVRPRKPLP